MDGNRQRTGVTVGRRSGNQDGRATSAHVNPRDAYRDVPILREPTWNEEIAAYFYLGGAASGAYTLGALASLFGGRQREKLAHTAYMVAFAAVVPCAPLLIADLGMASRFYHMMRIFKPSSPMNLGAWTLITDGAVTALMAMRSLARERDIPWIGSVLTAVPEKPLAAIGMLPALTLGGYTGVLIGTTSVPVWSTSSVLGGLFTASALATGTAAVSLASILTGRDTPSEHEMLGPLGLLFGATELGLTGGYLATSGGAAKPFREGVERLLLLGAILADATALGFETAGMATPSKRRLFRGLAAGSTLLSGALLRWSVIRAGHVSANDREGTLDTVESSPENPGWGPPGAQRSRD